MASSTLISVEQYLEKHVSGDHPPEFVRGELVFRPMPKWLHARVQALLAARLQKAGLVATELHLRVAEDVIRIADVAMYVRTPEEEIPSSPATVVIEVVSPDESYEGLLEKLQDYSAWGVPHIWVVEPRLRKFQVYQAGSLTDVAKFEIPESGFRLNAVELFAEAIGQ